jgi:alanine transaminase
LQLTTCRIPIPQYPLYTATLSYIHGVPLPYNLTESSGWSLSHEVLEETIAKAKKAGTPVKALVIINPGNPTGACLSLKDMEQVVQLCYDEGILLLADEVYQSNIFDETNKPFHSFKKVLRSMPEEVANGVELISFHSISKGMSGECGRRGGYFECVNLDDEVMEQVYKMASITLCPPVSGQVCTGRDLLMHCTNHHRLALTCSYHPPNQEMLHTTNGRPRHQPR